MILYNVTCLVDQQIEKEWIKWMKSEHLPEVMATDLFTSCKMFRIDAHEEGDSGTSYSVQYTARSRDHYQDYVSNHGPALALKTQEKFGEQVVAFRTLMEEV